MTGTVEGIFRCGTGGEAMESLSDARAVSGMGLEGDRYALGTGIYSARPRPDGGRELTLIEGETLTALAAETGIQLAPIETRRNIVTGGIRLDDLLGARFMVGEVECEGIDYCPPCVHLVEVTGKPVLEPLVGRGGLRARIVTGGVIRVGDQITAGSAQAAQTPSLAVARSSIAAAPVR